MKRILGSLGLVASLLVAASCSGGDDADGKSAAHVCKPPAPSELDPDSFIRAQKSCAYDCPTTACTEFTTPYACQNLADWATIPHAESCECFDGTYPAVKAGKCTASAPSGAAKKYAGVDATDAATTILPDGRRIQAAGKEWVFAEPDLKGGLPSGILAIPGTKLVVVVDTGVVDHALRVIDTTLVGSGDPVKSYVKFADPATLNSGMAFVAPDHLYVATDDGVVQALTLNTTTGALARLDSDSLTLPSSTDEKGNPAPWYVSGVAVSPDGKRLVVTGVRDKSLLTFDVDPASATFRQQLGSVDLGNKETFGVAFDPNDAAGRFVYVSMWANSRVAEVDVSNPAAPAVARSFATEKDPQGVAFLDARWLVVGNDLGDSLTLVDRVSGDVSTVKVDATEPLYGLEPSALAYDATAKRLYAALAGQNSVVGYDVDTSATPPKLTLVGHFPTSWWPSGIALLGDGTIAVSSLRGHGTGTNMKAFAIGDSDISDHLRGGVQVVPKPTAADWADGEQKVKAQNEVAALEGHPTISCPAGAADFPVPATNTEGPSAIIEHVFLIVRENKNFDALFGDLGGDVEGDASLTLKQSSIDMDLIWHNLRSLARTFTVGDNYYTAAVQSTQGHVWATHGRTNDFNERTWAISGAGRNARAVPGGGVIDVGKPAEGSVFDWLGNVGVDYDILGEIDGTPVHAPARNPIDVFYPGGPFQNIGYNDLEKACYFAGRARVTCTFAQFTYMTLPNDHTFGVGQNKTTPETYCAVNDEATGMVIDAISHSPLWKSSLILITQDDPLQGGEHIDAHRTPFVAISPWVKRGYVSKTHIDISSLHKLVAHIFGKPYPNLPVAHAGLPLDLFTSTPDYTPYTYTPRQAPLTCGGADTSRFEIQLTETWDFRHIDEQPGLGAQVWRFMRGQQLQALTPAQEERVARFQRGLPVARPNPDPDGDGD